MNCSYLTNRNPFIVQHVELRPIDSVIPLGHNPRTNSEAQIGQIAASIREFGFVNPILIGDDGVPRGTPEKRPMRDTSKPANGIRPRQSSYNPRPLLAATQNFARFGYDRLF